MAEFPAPAEGIVLTHFIVASDVGRTRRFYADIHAVYEQWRARGAEFLTPPADRRHELRCYMRDPDGHLIEVGQRIPG
jgi:catechol 2,3-dioxygenase-like lactoylglutathione lyase family enzyme